jgi:hypothetical protein
MLHLIVSGLGCRHHRKAGKEEKYDNIISSLVSTPSIPEPEIVRSSIPELPNVTPKDNHVEIPKLKKDKLKV